MFSRRKNETYLPGWLWFFLILPLALIGLLLYRWKRLPNLVQRLRPLAQSLPRPFNPTPRYTEPDSIPLEVHHEEVTAIEFETGTDEEDVAMAKSAVETPVEEKQPVADDLKMIEGIGPTIAGLLAQSGIETFQLLADSPIERLDEILTGARLRHLADPATWPEQARLAANGKWEELKQLQGTLKAGRRSKENL
jgi:predicted flap endonuclease-1-like 5' DNA nuclease